MTDAGAHRWTMDDDDDDEDRLSVCPFVRQRGARVGRSVWDVALVRSSRNGTSRARRRGRRRRRLEWFTSFQIVSVETTTRDDGARMVRRRR